MVTSSTPPSWSLGRFIERSGRDLWDAATKVFGPPRVVVRAGRYGRLGPRARALLPTLREAIEPERFAALAREHGSERDSERWKYLDLDTWLGRHLTHADAVGLFDGTPRRILDIGTGNGYFPFIAARLGHEVVATDIESVELYNGLVHLLGVRRVVHAVETFRLLPDFGGRFDLVTAFNTVFDRIDDTATWTPREWDFFLHDIRDHQLRSEGEIVLKLNPNHRRTYDKRAVADFFRSLGADVSLPYAHFRVEGGAFVHPRSRGTRASRGVPGPAAARSAPARAA
jgi:SAM-dependent methyltransferase